LLWGIRMDISLQADLLRSVPHLRAFAVSLTADREKAEDLVQETLLRALTHMDRFERGTNLQAWLSTILRNQFYTGYRKRRREREDPDGLIAAKVAVAPEQGVRLDYRDVLEAVAKLPPRQRQAILLIGAEGRTYQEAAAICRTSLGTMKSRVNRARTRLAAVLGISKAESFAAEPLSLAPTHEVAV
jgi:RNA polymerase sigma-70 factor, ECF subfamily